MFVKRFLNTKFWLRAKWRSKSQKTAFTHTLRRESQNDGAERTRDPRDRLSCGLQTLHCRAFQAAAEQLVSQCFFPKQITTRKANKKAQIILLVHNASQILRNNCNTQTCLILPQWTCVESYIWKHHRLYESYIPLTFQSSGVTLLTKTCS